MGRHTRHHHGQDAGYATAFKKSCARYMVWEGMQELMGKRHCWGEANKTLWAGNMVWESIQDITDKKHGKGKHTRHKWTISW